MFGPGFDSLQLHFYTTELKLKAVNQMITAFFFLT